MKKNILMALAVLATIPSFCQSTKNKSTKPHLFIDEHDLGPGSVTFDAAMAAHQKDLAVQGKHGVKFLKFWVDEKKGKIYCLASANDAQAINKAHKEAHGLLAGTVCPVSGGKEAKEIKGKPLFLDMHKMGPGNVTAEAVKGAHEKDLAVQKKHGVNFVNYWVDEKSGTIFCLVQAPDSSAISRAHKEAHGLLPVQVMKVKQGE
jgi:hypothetical protein